MRVQVHDWNIHGKPGMPALLHGTPSPVTTSESAKAAPRTCLQVVLTGSGSLGVSLATVGWQPPVLLFVECEGFDDLAQYAFEPESRLGFGGRDCCAVRVS